MGIPQFLPRYGNSVDFSFDPAAEKTCEELLTSALEVVPGHGEALQALSSVRMSQQRPDDAKACLEEAWAMWKDLDAGQFYMLEWIGTYLDIFTTRRR